MPISNFTHIFENHYMLMLLNIKIFYSFFKHSKQGKSMIYFQNHWKDESRRFLRWADLQFIFSWFAYEFKMSFSGVIWWGNLVDFRPSILLLVSRRSGSDPFLYFYFWFWQITTARRPETYPPYFEEDKYILQKFERYTKNLNLLLLSRLLPPELCRNNY